MACATSADASSGMAAPLVRHLGPAAILGCRDCERRRVDAVLVLELEKEPEGSRTRSGA
jgi:hypothetical protein